MHVIKGNGIAVWLVYFEDIYSYYALFQTRGDTINTLAASEESFKQLMKSKLGDAYEYVIDKLCDVHFKYNQPDNNYHMLYDELSGFMFAVTSKISTVFIPPDQKMLDSIHDELNYVKQLYE